MSEKTEKAERSLTMREAGRKGGATTAARHGHDYYCAIGRKGGQRVKELIEKARAAEKAEQEGDERG